MRGVPSKPEARAQDHAEPEEESSAASPVDSLLGDVKSALYAKRRDLVARANEIRSALAAYERAVEERIVRDFARDHSFRAPGPKGPGVEAAARRLSAAVLALPELDQAGGSKPALLANDAAPTPPAAPAAALEPAESEPAPPTDTLPWLTELSAARKLVIVGALSGRQKLGALPPSLEARTEWVDTDAGVHATINLPQRIRQGRVAAVIILDRAVQHKHTEPLVAAARAMSVPVGFAGKGGIASIRRALEQIDRRLEKA
jgi:hypothetical protein